MNAIRFDAPEISQPRPWTWHVMPLLIAVAAFSALFPTGSGSEPVAAVVAGAPQAEPMTAVLTPSPQPGEGEPELVVEYQTQSY